MGESGSSRRTFLKVAGGTVAAAGITGAAVTTTSAATQSWSSVSSPTSATLYGVSDTVAGPHAVGKSGNVLARRSDGTWEKVVQHGPATRENMLKAVSVTDDGKRIWFAGSSGALGCYDVEKGMKYDYSAPNEHTSTWEGITVTGPRESESIYVTNGSGEVYDAHTDDKGCVSFDKLIKPGSGSKISSIDFQEANASIGFAADTSGNCFKTADSSETWKDVGVPNAQVKFYDTIAYKTDTAERVYIAGGGGRLFRRDCTCDRWTPVQLGSKAFRSIARTSAKKVAVGSAGVGYENTGDGWTKMDMATSAGLNEVALNRFSDGPEVAVGASGTIVER